MDHRETLLRGQAALLRESSSSSPPSPPPRSPPHAGGPGVAGVDTDVGFGGREEGEEGKGVSNSVSSSSSSSGITSNGYPGNNENNLNSAVLRPGHARPNNADPRSPTRSSPSRNKQGERGGGGGGGGGVGGVLLFLVLLLAVTALGTIVVTITAGLVVGPGGAGAGARRRDGNGGEGGWGRGAASLGRERFGGTAAPGGGNEGAERLGKGASGSGVRGGQEVQDKRAPSSIDIILPRENKDLTPEGPPEAAKALEVMTKKGGKNGDTAERCDGYEKEYGIVPEKSWGTAPYKIQELWKTLRCDRVLAQDGFSLEDPPTGGRSRAIVFVWNKVAGWLTFLTPAFVKAARETCPTECVFTNEQNMLQKANGVLFHGPTHTTKDFPLTKPFGAKYIWVNLEPTTYAPIQNLLKDSKYMSRFDLTMTYQRSSDVPVGYVGSNPASYYFNAPKRLFQTKDGFGAPDAIAAFVSNCKAAGAPKRLRYMEELMKHATVHSFGGCLHNRDEPDLSMTKGQPNRQENKIAVLTRYKFLLAFENNDELQDYVTEKVYNGFQAGTLPVYWGASNVDDYVPKGSIVKASDFDGPKELAKHLKGLAEDEEAYEAYFKWREDPDEEERFNQEIVARSAYSVNAMCRLCDKVLEEQQKQQERRRR